MKTRIIPFFVCIFLVIAIHKQLVAQDIPAFSQYVLNPFLINPAKAGTTIYPELILTHRQQWAGIEDGPSVQILTFQSKIGKSTGLGAALTNDANGLTHRRTAELTYSHHLNFSKKTLQQLLSLGISVKIDESYAEEDRFTGGTFDPLVDGKPDRYYKPNASFGVFYINHNFFGGVSASNLIRIGKNGNPEAIQPITGFLQAAYHFPITEDFVVTPMVVYKTNEHFESQTDLNVKFSFYRSKTMNYWFSGSYRHFFGQASQPLNFQVATGIKLGRVYYGYVFDNHFNPLNRLSMASHEFLLGFNFSAEMGPVPCPFYKLR